MAHNWTSRLAHGASALGRVLRAAARPQDGQEIDADARRARADLDAVRARFPDHA